MELSTCELDAQLLERFSALGTRDKEELVNQLKAVVGTDISTDSCRFFLELSDWNIQRAVGAYFDFSFENSPPCFSGMVNHGTIMTPTTPSVNIETFTRPLYDLRVWPSSTSSKGTYEAFKVTVENSGLSQWHEGCYIRSESNPSIAKLADQDPHTGCVMWLPLGPSGRVPLPPAHPGQFVDLLISVNQPPSAILNPSSKNLVGAMSFCSSTGDVFGETLYCTAIPDVVNQIWAYQRGVPDSTAAKLRMVETIGDVADDGMLGCVTWLFASSSRLVVGFQMLRY
ncbi:Protein ilrun, variant 2 [Clonorchis sinensis]|uniref:Protein ilrun, variant 2 n=1 Tax=Clonorchis sinensis TaxID=79923 RepID=A0A8T1MK32_CLOSI|nr:Protein ilrun, variant 2 [Clonorchis sinensis]